MDRADRIGAWISGIAHAGLIGWLLVSGAIFRPLDAPAIRMTEVATMSEAEFQAYAAGSRGSGPVESDETQISSLPDPDIDDTDPGAPEATVAPATDDVTAELPSPAAQESTPDLSDMDAQAPISVATEIPQVALPAESAETTPEIALAPQAVPARPTNPAASGRPELPVADSGITPAETPRSPLALNSSPRPQVRPEGLVAARDARLAAAAAAQRAALAEEARAEAAAREQAEAEAARQAQAAADARAEAAQQAEADADARRQAELDDLAAAEEQAEALAQAIAAQRNEDALAAAREEEARQQEEARAAEARQAELDAEAERQAEAERAEAERIAAAEAEAEAEAERLAREQAAAAARAAEDDALAEALRTARDEAARDEQAVRDAEAAAAVAASRTEPGGDELAMALDQALDAPGARNADGPPLSASEKDGFRVAVERCWNKGMLSVEAARTTVSIRLSMTPDGRPEEATLRLVGQSGGGDAAAQQAFDVARRAILRCQGNGYPLPMDKYNRWKEIVIDFRPDGAAMN